MGQAVTSGERKSLPVQRCFQVDLDRVAGLHGDGEGDGFEAGD